ncbi:Transmembrane protein 106A [Echinococcus granulosus]|uniref:Transmembrane protein 106A n=1 Tax=Echinococcus granulosus TaxID=6210 RepID=W6UFX4_ECHGR|nr:Transmembrane protein 106A [Echinococcus granulosus]EUB60375.1 Transmembrane protein 106A [Echinococcus granulosus]
MNLVLAGKGLDVFEVVRLSLKDVDSSGGGGEYIALIPLTDKRLRPQRITVKIFITVILCLALSGLLVFFLLPRSIRLQSSASVLLPSDVQIKDDVVSLNFSVSCFFSSSLSPSTHSILAFVSAIVNVYPFNVTNWNYVPLYVETVNLLSLYHSTVLNVGNARLNEWVPARTTRELHVYQILEFDEPVFSMYLPKLCLSNNTEYNQIYISFVTSIQVNALSQRFESVMDTVQLVSCHPKYQVPSQL